ncbi:MAG: hemerythrin domain-containing protein [Acidobacteriota bacterium]
MAVTIGGKAENDYTNPLGMLSDCHRRIERFLRTLITVTDQARGRELSREERDALETALRYFREAAPRHTEDEEESLFPRMRACPQAAATLERLDALHTDHEVADSLHEEADLLGREWLTEGSLSTESVRRLIEALKELRAIYERHIAEEDTRIFPLAAEILPRDAIEALAREMASRRSVALDGRLRAAGWNP